MKKVAKRIILSLMGFFGMMMFTACYGMPSNPDDIYLAEPDDFYFEEDENTEEDENSSSIDESLSEEEQIYAK